MKEYKKPGVVTSSGANGIAPLAAIAASSVASTIAESVAAGAAGLAFGGGLAYGLMKKGDDIYAVSRSLAKVQ